VRLAIVQGTLITAEGKRRANVFSDNGKITAIEEGIDSRRADEIEDARGLLVFPGFIDPHIHSRDPGLTEKEDFAHVTRAAAAGGVTTVFDMPNTVPPLTNAELFKERAQQHQAKAHVDFGLWGLGLGRENLHEVPPMLRAGVVGIKLFLGYVFDRSSGRLRYETEEPAANKVIPPPSTDQILAVMKAVATEGGLVGAHCEDRSVIEALSKRLAHPVGNYEELLFVRPAIAEAVSIMQAANLAMEAGCRFHALHVSSEFGVETVRMARRIGATLTAETCPHFLTLTADRYGELGTRLKTFPPVRTELDRQVVLSGLLDGTIESVGSDHAPHTEAEKAMPFDRAPAGMTGVETMVPVMLDLMNRGKLSPERIGSVLSTGTARIYGVWPQKGSFDIGADADFTIVDPEARMTIQGTALHSKQKWTAWEGCHLRGRPKTTILRGQVVAREGEPVGAARGQLVVPRIAPSYSGK
jgi:dihydroorotase